MLAKEGDSLSVYEKALKYQYQMVKQTQIVVGDLMEKGLTHFQVPWLGTNIIYLAENCLSTPAW